MADTTGAAAAAAAAVAAAAESEEDPGCWQKKAAYEQCFDQWYKDVFLQHKANGQAGCREEYAAYWSCFAKELRKEKALMDGIKAVMPADAKQRWTANMDAQEQRENAAARSKQE